MSNSYAAIAEMLKEGGMDGGIYGGDDETHEMFGSSDPDPAVEGFLSDIVGGDINIFGGTGLLPNIEDHSEDDGEHPDFSPFVTAGNEDVIEDPVFDDIMESDEDDTTGGTYIPETPEEEHREEPESVDELKKESISKFDGAFEVIGDAEESEDKSEFVTGSTSGGGEVSDISKGITDAVSDIYL